MDRAHFTRECYLKTGGWLPLNPPSHHLELGDFCQIQHGELRILGSILDLQLVGNTDLKEVDFALNENNWKLSSGVHQAYCSTERISDEDEDELWRTKQVLSFSKPGSFVFNGSRPQCRILTNWSEFEQDITIHLTQRSFAFRQLYVITQLACVDDWALAIARESNAQLEMSSEVSDTDYFRLLSHPSCKVEQSTEIGTLLRSSHEPARFFKAKKLVLKQKKREYFLNEMLKNREGWSDREMAVWLDEDLLNLVESNELNIATCMDFFTWADSSLDEAEMLCRMPSFLP
jgi:hypothetical protein